MLSRELNLPSPYTNLTWFDVGILIGVETSVPKILVDKLKSSIKNQKSEDSVQTLLELGDFLAGCEYSNKYGGNKYEL